MYRRFGRRCSYYDFNEREQEAQDLMNNKQGGGYMPLDPELSFTAEETETNSKYTTVISKAAEEFATKYVLGAETGDTAWNNWLKKAESLGAKEIIDAYNNAQARYEKLTEKNRSLKKKNRKLNKQLKKSKKLNDQLMSSSSWKITKPLRGLKRILK